MVRKEELGAIGLLGGLTAFGILVATKARAKKPLILSEWTAEMIESVGWTEESGIPPPPPFGTPLPIFYKSEKPYLGGAYEGVSGGWYMEWPYFYQVGWPKIPVGIAGDYYEDR